jgi:hypothetical protein
MSDRWEVEIAAPPKMTSRTPKTWLLLVLVAVTCTTTAAAAQTSTVYKTTSTSALATAIFDPIFLSPQRDTAFAMAKRAGATYARVIVAWRSIAPTVEPTEWTLADQADPRSPHYDWTTLDATVKSAVYHGIQPILNINGAPPWAWHVHPAARRGGQPRTDMLGAFATALASRYKGVVHAYSVYNEVNFSKNMYPQSPLYYRSMVNAVADAAHAVDPSNIVLAGELSPAKAKQPTTTNSVVTPMTWMRQMLCLSDTTPVHRTCTAQTRFDVWTHHPYSDRGPFGHSRVNGGISLGDLPKMKTLLHTAWQLGAITTQSGQVPRFWVTEMGWSTNPPNKHAAPTKLVTRWTSEALWQEWRSGVALATWFLLQDIQPGTPFQSGLYLRSPTLAAAKPKAVLAAFTFPLVAYLKSAGRVYIWGRDPHGDAQNVLIQRSAAHGWATVATIATNHFGVFQATVSVHASSSWILRAVTATGGPRSAPFTLTVPSNEQMNVAPFPVN